MEIVGHSDYIASAGETWDEIAFQYYYDEKFSHYIINANVRYIDVIKFAGGEALKVPIFDVLETSETLPPWRQ